MSEIWKSRLYVARQKANSAEAEEYFLADFNRGEWDAYRALDIAKKVEIGFMSIPDFKELRTTNDDYKKLVEEFAMNLSSDIQSRDINHDSFPINFVHLSFVSHEQSYREQAEKFKRKACEIAVKHNTPEEKAEYIAFAMRGFIREFIRGRYIRPNNPELPKGVAQLIIEMVELDQQKGQYELNLGSSHNIETISRLVALADRQVYTVNPIPPTPSFLTKDLPDSINAIYGDRI